MRLIIDIKENAQGKITIMAAPEGFEDATTFEKQVTNLIAQGVIETMKKADPKGDLVRDVLKDIESKGRG